MFDWLLAVLERKRPNTWTRRRYACGPLRASEGEKRRMESAPRRSFPAFMMEAVRGFEERPGGVFVEVLG